MTTRCTLQAVASSAEADSSAGRQCKEEKKERRLKGRMSGERGQVVRKKEKGSKDEKR